MTANEIKKALECRVNCNSNECSECLYRIGEYLCDVVTSAKDTLVYINQLEAEIKYLKKLLGRDYYVCGRAQGKTQLFRVRVNLIKSEAVKEFTERLKRYFNPDNSYDIRQYIDNLVKEMVGDNNEENSNII